MYNTVSFINTLGTNEYRNLILQTFSFDDITKYFFGWKKKEMVNWVRYVQNKYVIDVFTKNYEIINNIKNEKYKLPYPKTINDFINDMDRLGIILMWDNLVIEKYEPKDYLPVDKIPEYYKNLLNSLNKGHELIYNK